MKTLKRIYFLSLLTACCFFHLGNVQANDKLKTRILFVLDASSSMSIMWHDNNSRMDVAKQILTEIVDSLEQEERVQLALRVYGHQSPVGQRNCQDTRLEVGFRRNNTNQIREKLSEIRPRGTTPIAYTLQQAARDFPDNTKRNIIILLTDGEETCGGNPCEIAREMEEKGIVLRHFAIGIGLTEEVMQSFNCFGTNYNAQDAGRLRATLQSIIQQVIDETTVQINLTNRAGRQSYTDHNITYYNDFTAKQLINLYHTVNHGRSDTIFLDPVLTYNIQVHTTPALWKKDVSITPRIHNNINITTSQGKINFRIPGISIPQSLERKLYCMVFDNQNNTLLQAQNNRTIEPYLTGRYNIEVSTLPLLKFHNTQLNENQVYNIEVANPGWLNLMKRIEVNGGIFIQNESGELDMIYSLKAGQRIENIALQPGVYQIIYRPRAGRTMYQTETITFRISSGESLRIEI